VVWIKKLVVFLLYKFSLIYIIGVRLTIKINNINYMIDKNKKLLCCKKNVLHKVCYSDKIVLKIKLLKRIYNEYLYN